MALIPPAQAQTVVLRLFARCVPVMVWVKGAETNNIMPTILRVDGDGDAWTFWESGKMWWLTVTQDDGATICPIARSKDKPDET